MLVTELFIIGRTTVPSSWIALIVAFVVAYSAIRMKYGKSIAEVLADAIFYFMIVWKLSVIVTDFGSVIKSPLSIVYFHGGLVGFYLGLFVAAISVLIKLKRRGLARIDSVALFVGVVLIQAIYQVMMVLLNEGALVAQIMTIMFFTLFAIFIWIIVGKVESSPIQLALLFMAMHFFVAAFQPAGVLGTSVLATLMISLFFSVFLFRGPVMEMEELK